MQVRSGKKNIIGKVCAVSADLTQSFLRTIKSRFRPYDTLSSIRRIVRVERRVERRRLINRAVSRLCWRNRRKVSRGTASANLTYPIVRSGNGTEAEMDQTCDLTQDAYGFAHESKLMKFPIELMLRINIYV